MSFMSFLSAQGALSSSQLTDFQYAESILLTRQLNLRKFVHGYSQLECMDAVFSVQ